MTPAEISNAQEERKVQTRAIERDFVEAWCRLSFPVIEGTDDVMKLGTKKLKPEMVEFILSWLPAMDNRFNTQEWLVRGLNLAEKPFDGTVLTEMFDDSGSKFNLKWAIGDTIGARKLLSIEGWLNKTILAAYSKEKEMLVYGLWKYFPYEQARKLAMKVYDNYPLHASSALSRIGRRDDFEFLTKKFNAYNGPGRAVIRRSLKRFEARLLKREK